MFNIRQNVYKQIIMDLFKEIEIFLKNQNLCTEVV